MEIYSLRLNILRIILLTTCDKPFHVFLCASENTWLFFTIHRSSLLVLTAPCAYNEGALMITGAQTIVPLQKPLSARSFGLIIWINRDFAFTEPVVAISGVFSFAWQILTHHDALLAIGLSRPRPFHIERILNFTRKNCLIYIF